jgi:hypothetical protein
MNGRALLIKDTMAADFSMRNGLSPALSHSSDHDGSASCPSRKAISSKLDTKRIIQVKSEELALKT